MKILLVKPVLPTEKNLHSVPPLGLGYLATALKKSGVTAEILDCPKERLDSDGFVNEINRRKPDIVGLQLFSRDLESARLFLELTKKCRSEIVTVIGGPHPSGAPEESLLLLEKADFGFRGEAEIGFPDFVNKLKRFGAPSAIPEEALRQVPGLIWRNKDRIISNAPVFVEDLDTLGYPDWEQMDPRSYQHAPHGVFFRRLPIAPIMATRGCPFLCTFCAGYTVTGRRIRFRSIANVIGEIKYLREQFGVREIHLLDDNFTMKKEYVRAFCRSLIEEHIDISWTCPNGVRLDSLDEETLLLMKKSGCYCLSVGVESGSPKILAHMKKNISLEEIEKQVGMIRRVGIPVIGFFIIGYPEEEKSDICKSIEFSLRAGFTRAAFFSFLPLPGTEIYRQLRARGEIGDIDWNRMFQAGVPYAPKGMDKNEIKKLQRIAHLKFYLRPGTFFALIREIKTFNQFMLIVRRFFTYILSG